MSHSWYVAAAVNSRRTRSSCTGGPDFRLRLRLPGVHRPQPLGRAQPIDPVTGGGDALVSEVVGDEPVMYSIHEDEVLVRVVRISHRADVYG